MLAEQVWISDDEAKRVMRESPWGQLKQPTLVTNLNFLDNLLGRLQVISRLTEDEKRTLKFSAYISRTLDQFCAINANSVRVIEGKREIDEVSLKRFLDKAIESELIKDFGDIPDYRVE